jgi:Ca2+-binding RTX toxin-like protein
MEGFDNKSNQSQLNVAGLVDPLSSSFNTQQSLSSKGSSVQTTDFENAINQTSPADEHSHSEGATSSLHVSLDNVASLRNLNIAKTRREFSLREDVGKNGDLFDPGAGNNTIIGSSDKDVFLGNKGGSNTITTGAGRDTIILGEETTNKITDFDVSKDRLIFDTSLDLNNIVIAQGKNTTEGSLDSTKNALIIDKTEGHVLASLTNVDVSALSNAEVKGLIKQLDGKTLDKLNKVPFAVQEGDGQLIGTTGSDRLIGHSGDDLLVSDPANVPPPATGGGTTGGSPDPSGTPTPPAPGTGSTTGNEHDHTGAGASSADHVALDQVDVVRGLDRTKLRNEITFSDDLGFRGDFLSPGAGKNTVIGTGDKDIIDGRGGGFNTITTGGGKDSILIDSNSTNRILDFDVNQDRILFSKDINLDNIVIAQGKNPGKGGINQPLDSVNNTLIIDKSDGHILASLAFTKATALQGFETTARKAFSVVDDSIFSTLDPIKFKTVQAGNGQLTGTRGHDKLVGGTGDDFLYVGDDGFKFKTASASSGADEFPFKNDSPGSSQINLQLKNGVLTAKGSYQNFDGLPLFSQGETTIDPKATILNGSDPVSLINNFLKVPNDVEGNPISGTHLHFSPSGDDRGNFADATVVRYFTNTVVDAKSGTITGEFHLKPEEQAALLAGDLYMNIHTNRDGDGDGKAGFPTGENRINFNKNVVQLL